MPVQLLFPFSLSIMRIEQCGVQAERFLYAAYRVEDRRVQQIQESIGRRKNHETEADRRNFK